MVGIDWAAYRSIVVLTGAGISVASGLRPYRGPGGLWSEIDVDSLVTGAAVARDPRRVWAQEISRMTPRWRRAIRAVGRRSQAVS